MYTELETTFSWRLKVNGKIPGNQEDTQGWLAGLHNEKTTK